MSYLALARKWRPRTFSQLLGQEPTTKALVNALNQQRLHHAYVFTGTRGVGKTSVARILAKALNCEQGVSGTPCLSCDACTAIEQGRFIDLIEIDGASKTRVEDIRELLDNVQYASTNARFKIYLIDEVHMLSQHSFNALLKTLEEPPAHVKFILATTDPQKLPVTVLSRCLQFNLKQLTADVIKNQMAFVLQEEGLAFEIEALEILARAAKGSMRDGLSLLDNAINCAQDQLRAQDVKLILGYTKEDYALEILQALASQDAPSLLKLCQDIEAEGGHFDYVLDELQTYLHQMAVFLCIGDDNPLLCLKFELKTLALQFSPEDLQLFYQIALKGREEIHFAPLPAIGLSMTLLRMLLFRPAPLAPQQARMPAAKTPPAPEIKVEIPKPHAIKKSPPLETPLSLDWPSLIAQLNLSGLALTALENAVFLSKEGKNLSLGVSEAHRSLFTPNTLVRLETALADYYKSPVKLILESKNNIESSPRQEREKRTQEKQDRAEKALLSDAVFQQIKEDFSAELVKNSIVLVEDEL